MQDSVRRARPMLGTFVDISVTNVAGQDVDAVIDEAFEAIARVHGLMSFQDAGSDVSRLNREASARPIAVHPWTLEVLRTAIALRELSSGVFDMSVAPVLQELGLLSDHVGRGSVTSTRAAEVNAIEVLPDDRICFRDSGVKIDLSGIAKGFAVDRAARVLRKHGIPGGIVNAGGDLAVFGLASHDVYLRNPIDPSGPMCLVEVSNEALASSGFRHDPFASVTVSDCAVVDPRSRRQVEDIRGASVRAKSCMLADALTKIAMIEGETALATLNHYDASALLVFACGDVLVTPNWKGAGSLAA